MKHCTYLIVFCSFFIFLKGSGAEEHYLIRIEQLDESLQKRIDLHFRGKDFFLVSLSSGTLSKIEVKYELLDKITVGDIYALVLVRKPEDLEKLKEEVTTSRISILDFFDHTALVKGKFEEIIKLTEKGFKIKLLPEKIPWPEQVKYFAPSIPFKSLAEETADTQIINEILQNFTTTQYAGYIQYLQDLGTRYSYSPKSIETKDYLVNKFQEFAGLTVSTHSFFYGVTGNTTHYNVIATLPGKNTEVDKKVYILCAHYDSISNDPYNNAPGADDNASGVAALLLAAEHMSSEEFNATIRFIAFAAEEQGLIGSQRYAQEMFGKNEQILAVINLDMIAWWEQGVKYDLNITANANSQWLSDYLYWVNTKYVNMPLDRRTNDSAWWGDHSSFWDYGYPAVDAFEAYNWYSEDFNPDYHTTKDTLDKLNLDFALKNTKLCIATICELADPYPTKLTLLEPDGRNDTVSAGREYKILWTGTTNQVLLYYAKEIGGEKKLIATIDGSAREYSWDTTGIWQGQYYIYAETQNSDSDWSSGPLTVLSTELKVYVHPNPFYWAKDYQITFVGLPEYAELKIYTLSGELVFEQETRNQRCWPWRVKDIAEKPASGIYLFVIKDATGKKSQGKIAIIK